VTEQTNSSSPAKPLPDFLVIGQIRKPHGVRGEIKVAIHTDVPERFLALDVVHISKNVRDKNPRAMEVEQARFQGSSTILLSFVDVLTREDAEKLRQHWIFVPIEDAIELEENEYFLFELLGMEVVADGSVLGKVTNVLETGANNVFVVKGNDGKEYLVPDIPSVVQSLDFETNQILVTVIEGLFE